MKDRNLEHSDDWATPKEFYDKLNEEFNFNFDPCPLNHNLDEFDGLKIEWKKRNFINPPYSSDEQPCKYNCKKKKCAKRGFHRDVFVGGKESFVKKAVEESRKGKLCVMLLPVSTSTELFHKIILPENPEIRFIYKRIKFLGINTKGEYVTDKVPMHDSMVVIFDGRKNGCEKWFENHMDSGKLIRQWYCGQINKETGKREYCNECWKKYGLNAKGVKQ